MPAPSSSDDLLQVWILINSLSNSDQPTLAAAVDRLASLFGATDATLFSKQPSGWQPTEGSQQLSTAAIHQFESSRPREILAVGDGRGASIVAAHLPRLTPQTFLVLTVAPPSAAAVADRLKLADAQFEAAALRERLDRAGREVSRFAGCLDLMVALNAEDRFASAAMLLCNELATRFSADRVSLGWLEGHQTTIRAISHTEKFEPKMETVQQLAAAMDEAVDQEEEIAWPRPDGHTYIVHDHAKYATAQKLGAAATIPVLSARSLDPQRATAEQGHEPTALETASDGIIGTITLERLDSSPFNQHEITSLRLVADQVARRLADLHRYDRWIGARALDATRRSAARLIGVEHTWAKILGIVVAVTLAVLVFGKKQHRVEAPFTLDTDAVAYLPAPFDGFLADIAVRVGDTVERGDLLFSLDQRELLLQRETARAELARYAGESVRAEATGDTAAMRVAQSQQVQAQAQLDLVTYRLEQSEIRAPFPGIVVEGDLRERAGAPVSQGEVLMRLAESGNLYPELQIDERDIAAISGTPDGTLAFASRPGTTFDVSVERVEPVARSTESGNAFTVRCAFAGSEPQPDWWRPGMSGVAKIDCGRRTLLWIYTHRTIDWLRLKLF